MVQEEWVMQLLNTVRAYVDVCTQRRQAVYYLLSVWYQLTVYLCHGILFKTHFLDLIFGHVTAKKLGIIYAITLPNFFRKFIRKIPMAKCKG